MTDNTETGEVTTVARPAQAPAIAEPQSFPTPFTGPTDKIDKAIAVITSEAAPVLKGGYNDFHKYKYSRIEDYTDVIGPLLGKHGLAVYETSVGRNEIGGMVYVDYAFYISTEGQRIGPLKYTGMARARDSKGNFDPACIAKTLTAARKQFYTAQFHLKTTDDPDRDAPPRRQAPMQQPQQQTAPIDATNPKALPLVGDEPWENWSHRFLNVVGMAPDLDTLERWLENNKGRLEQMRDDLPDHHAHVMRQYQKRVLALQPAEPTQ